MILKVFRKNAFYLFCSCDGFVPRLLQKEEKLLLVHPYGVSVFTYFLAFHTVFRFYVVMPCNA